MCVCICVCGCVNTVYCMSFPLYFHDSNTARDVNNRNCYGDLNSNSKPLRTLEKHLAVR